jgi:hypothetical protein
MIAIIRECPYCHEMYGGADLRIHYETECKANPSRPDPKTDLTDKLTDRSQTGK